MSPDSSIRLIRIFLSSPGDVADERAIARKIIDDLAADPLLRDRVVVRSVAWDSLSSRTPMLATLTPQEAINRRLPKPSDCDIMAVLFWSRMGTPLPHPEYQKPDGQPYQSGTEWEYLDAVSGAKKHAHGLPLVAIYRRTEEPTIKLSDPQKAEKIEQWEQVQAFFAQFTGPGGVIRGGVNTYESPDDFRRLFEHDVRELIDTVLDAPTDAPPPPSRPVEETRWPGSPFPGLRAFTPADAPIFFGRGRETDALIKRVSESRFVAVVGASGSGKSSLVGAGLLPRLKDNAISGEHLGSKDWRIVSFKPGEKEGDPFRALADALVVAFPSLIPSPLEAKRLKDEFVASLKADPASLADTCAAALAHDPAWAEMLLFIDQFEELFTVVDETLRAPFVDLLNSVAQAARLRTVVTMRADFYHRCVQYKALEELLRAGSFPLGAPGQIALGEMITRPAERARLQWEDSYLPERILQDTGSEPGSLALMAYTLDELYRACKDSDGSMLSHAAYERLGGVQGAIGTRAETAFDHLPGDDAAKGQMLQRVFLALVEVDERGTTTRRRAPKAQLLAIDGAAALIDYFAGPEVRLLVTSGDDDHAEVEVAHEALLRNWERLSDWIEATQDDLRLVRRIEREAREWERRGKPDHMRPNAEELAEYHAALDRLGIMISDPLLEAFCEPEQARLLRELENIDTTHARRSAIGERLCAIGDTRPGVGLRPNGLPDIVWCAVPGGEIEIKGEIFTVKPFYIAKYPITFMQFQAFLDDPDGWDQDEWWQGLGQKQQDRFEQRFKFANHPRENVSWYQAVAFACWLTAKLPPEAWPEHALIPQPLRPEGEGEKFREMARETMTQIARDLRKRQTNAESLLWECLRDRRLGGIKFRRQHPVAETTYVVDFFSYEANLIVELDGPIHDRQREDDIERQRHLEYLGYTVIRFTNDQVFNDLETVLSTILATHHALSLLLEGEGPGMRANWQIRLPAEWEWQWAATGGNPDNTYPWGPDWESGRRCNTTESGLSRTTAVGMYPYGSAACGALDMSGNVWEWCLNEYDKPANAGTVGDAGRVLRGGSWGSDQDRARAAYRYRSSPDDGSRFFGFRVVCASPI